MIEIKQLKVTNTNGDTILKNVDLHLKQGEINTIVGVRGSGKTSLLRTLHRYLSDQQYDCRWVTKIPQFVEGITGYEYIDMLLAIDANRYRPLVEKFIEVLFLDEQLKLPIKEVYPITRETLNIIATICLEGDFVLFDNPLYLYDQSAQQVLLEIFEQLKQDNKCIIMTLNGLDLIPPTSETYVITNGTLEPIQLHLSGNDYQAVILNKMVQL